MRDVGTKENGEGEGLDATDFNSTQVELENAVSSADFTLDNAGGPDNSLTMLGQTIAAYANAGNLYQDSGTANSYALSISSNLKVIAEYYAGLKIAFIANTSSTGASILNINSIGDKTLKKSDGSDVGVQDVRAGQFVEAYYDGTDFLLLERRTDKKQISGVDTGAADAYVVDVLDPPDVYFSGMELTFTPANVNTGTSTINVNSLGTKNILRLGGVALNAGDIPTEPLKLLYDGTQFILLNAKPISSVAPILYQNLYIAPNGTNPLYQLDITADFLNIEGANKSTITLTVDITASGVNGLDTGTEAGSTFYHVHAIYNPTTDTVASLLSLQYPGSGSPIIFPSGYTQSQYLGAVYNDATPDFEDFTQTDNRVRTRASNTFASTLTNTTYSSVSLVAFVPQTAISIDGYADQNTTNESVYYSTTTAGLGEKFTTFLAGHEHMFEQTIINQEIFMKVSAGQMTTATLSGYIIKN